jgi:hypothetical protein
MKNLSDVTPLRNVLHDTYLFLEQAAIGSRDFSRNLKVQILAEIAVHRAGKGFIDRGVDQ